MTRGLGWDPGGLDVLRAVGWDPRKHPRVLHGEHGGQFARKPGAGLAEAVDPRGDPKRIEADLSSAAQGMRHFGYPKIADDLDVAAVKFHHGALGEARAFVLKAADAIEAEGGKQRAKGLRNLAKAMELRKTPPPKPRGEPKAWVSVTPERLDEELGKLVGVSAKDEVRKAHATLADGDAPGTVEHLREAAALASMGHHKHASDRQREHGLRVLAGRLLTEWGGSEHTAREIRDRLDATGKDSGAWLSLKYASDAYNRGQWELAVSNLNTATITLSREGNPLDAELARRLASFVQSDRPGEDWLDDFASDLAAEIELAMDPTALGWLHDAARSWDAGRPDDVATQLREAGKAQIQAGHPIPQARLFEMADRVEAKLGANAKLIASVQAFVAKGADKVPKILGGGVETWDRKLSVVPELPSRSLLGTTLAEMDWAGHMTMIEAVAKGISTDLHMTGEPIASMDSFTVPLHELIHNSIGGRYQAQVKAHEQSGRTAADDVMLARFASLDFARADGGPAQGGIPGVYTPSEINGHEWVNAVQEAATLREAKAQIEDLERRGFLEWSGTSSSVGGGPYERQYRRTAKAIATDPPRASDAPQPDEGKWPYQQQEVQAIEEGFTELGTIQHAAEYFNATGIGGRETPIKAVSHKPDPVAKAKLARDLEGHAGEVPGEAHLWMEAARKLRRDDQFGAQRELSKIWDLRVGDKERSRQVMMLKADISGLYLPHTVDNPAYVRRRAALVKDLTGTRDRVTARIASPGEYAADRIVNLASLNEARQALTRALGDLEHGDPVNDVLEELARVQHLGDKELHDDAIRLTGQIHKLSGTPQEKRATLAEYARRVNDRDRIVNGDAWGHYGEWTKQALLWCEAVAMAEGLKGKRLTARVRALADEINRESAAGKLDVMAGQALVAYGRKDTRRARESAASVIRSDWLEFGPLIAFEHVKDRVAA